MRLGFHYHTPAIQQRGAVRMPGYLGLFVDSLAAQCDSVVCFQHSPAQHEAEQIDYTVKSTNVSLVGIGPHSAVPLRTVSAYLRRGVLLREQAQLDVLLVRAPTPLLPVYAPVWRKPIVLLLVADAVAGIENLPQPGWRKALIRLHANWIQAQQSRVVQRSLTFVNSKLLFEQHRPWAPNLVQTQTTTLSETDFHPRDDTCQGGTYRLLFTGRMARTKGLLEIVTAMANLVDAGFDLVLDLVGMVDAHDPILDDVRVVAESRGIGRRVQYLGYKTAGLELLAYYRRADVYVTAPQASSEGFPRAIWEAMASSLPVVATRVGSLPAFIGDAAVLVPPKDEGALTEALRDVLTGTELRRRLIRKGMALARDNTLERRAGEMVREIERWLARAVAA